MVLETDLLIWFPLSITIPSLRRPGACVFGSRDEQRAFNKDHRSLQCSLKESKGGEENFFDWSWEESEYYFCSIRRACYRNIGAFEQVHSTDGK
jgi:hypothetical protein